MTAESQPSRHYSPHSLWTTCSGDNQGPCHEDTQKVHTGETQASPQQPARAWTAAPPCVEPCGWDPAAPTELDQAVLAAPSLQPPEGPRARGTSEVSLHS